MRSLQLSAGTVHYRESGGSGPVALFVHGALVNGQLWEPVVRELGGSFRCIVPDWPLGAHSEALGPGADVTAEGVARLIAEFLEALELRDVTLIGNDSGGALCQWVAARDASRLAGLVLTNCDALDVFPPRAYAYLKWIARLPRAMAMLTRALYRWPTLARAPLAFGSLTRRRIPDPLLAAWLRPAAQDPGVRADAARFLASLDPAFTQDAARELRSFPHPVRLVWGADDPFFSLALARRLAAVFPDSKLVPISDARTFVALDQPERVARELAAFLAPIGPRSPTAAPTAEPRDPAP